MKKAILSLVVSGLSLVGSAAWGQSRSLPGFTLDNWQVDPASTQSMVVGSGLLLPRGTFRVSANLGYEQNPLSLYDAAGNRLATPIHGRLLTTVTGAWTPIAHLELGLTLPVVVYQRGDDLSAFGFRHLASAGLEIPVVQGRYAFLEETEHRPISLAAHLGIGIPIGSQAAVAGERGPLIIPKLLAGYRTRYLRLSAELGALFRAPVDLNGQYLGTVLLAGLSASTNNPGLRGEVAVNADIPLTGVPVTVNIFVGGRLPLPLGLEVFALAGPGFGQGPGTAVFRALVGIAYGR